MASSEEEMMWKRTDKIMYEIEECLKTEWDMYSFSILSSIYDLVDEWKTLRAKVYDTRENTK